MDHFGASLLSALPNFDPFMSLNLSCTCATTKLVQCVNYGTEMCDVTRKFLYQSAEQATDLARDDFMARKKLIEHVQQFDSKQGEDKWTPILYAYDIAKGSSKRQEDLGHMVFTDSTLSRFLMVLLFGPPGCACGNPYHNDYEALTRMHANQFMSLLKYVYCKPDHPQPEWVRATYTTNAQNLNPAFLISANLESDNPPAPPSSNSNTPKIINVLSTDFIPSLTEHHLGRIDALLGRSKSWGVPSPAIRKSVKGKGGKPNPNTRVYKGGREQVQRECGNCRKVDPKLQTCGRCKVVFYCSPACQKEHWSVHKILCKKPSVPTANKSVNVEEVD